MEMLLLIAVLAVSLFLIPLGLPGLWIMIASAFVYRLLVPGSIGIVTIAGIIILGVIAEWWEFTMAGQYARKYGGSRRASWGAVIGGTIGAIMGVPVPVIGSIIGGLLGAFAGALVFEMSKGEQSANAPKVATGAMIGRAMSAAMKTGIGVLVAVWIFFAAF
ncbi:MAG TPA: DUF456 domain-containing protein [Gemmatimonadaceae bacterium]|nr:DUF456 domain-containing protein [Gemmatimonadaceae bacterium]HEU5173835.1 DUF456 domain-containing protein [Gemmatimonadaceae bacterium]